jgi:hypothetical protein
MPRKTGWTPMIVPYGADQTVHLDRFAELDTVYRETEVEQTDLETIITDLMAGQFDDPAGVVVFNTPEHWSEDVSEYIAFEIQTRYVSKAPPFPSMFATSSPATSVRIASSPCGSAESVSWDQQFYDPIIVPGREPLVTLRDAAGSRPIGTGARLARVALR